LATCHAKYLTGNFELAQARWLRRATHEAGQDLQVPPVDALLTSL